MATWEEIFTSSNPAGGRMINVISGVAGSEASPYTADNPAGGRAINVNLIGGGNVATGVLQLNGGVPLDTTLRSVTDQANTVSPLQLSTTSVNVTSIFYVDQDIQWNNNLGYGLKSANGTRVLSITNTLMSSSTTPLSLGTSTNSARLHVRGDGSNPVGRFENSSANAYFQINANGSVFILGNAASDTFRIQENQLINVSSGTVTGISYTMSGSFASGAGSANFRPLNIAYTINNSGAQSGTATGIFLNATETALNGMTHNLFDLQIENVSIFKGTRAGLFTSGVNKNLTFAADGNVSVTSFTLRHSSNEYGYADIQLTAAVSNQFNRFEIGIAGTNILRVSSNQLVQFGGFTNAFPALKRNGADLHARLADDSAFCNIQGKLTTDTNYTAGAIVVTGYLTLYDATGTAYRVPCVV